MFIREFNSETQAQYFAAIHNGKVYIHYDYDPVGNKIIKVYRVRY